MPAVKIADDIHWVGLNDRTTDLFEGIWPIAREGVSYNSYIVTGEQTALIDLVKAMRPDEYLSQIAEVTDLAKIDYLVINHMEPDHSGLVRTFLRLAPRVTVLGSAKTVDMLAGFFDVRERVRPVADGETLSLGRRSLKFFSTPFLHWPETIMTCETTNKVLFSCDAFGGYGAIQNSLFDDECQNPGFYEKEALRYYVNIVAKYSPRVLDAVAKLGGEPVEIVAPSHGLIWRKSPSRIIGLYKKWAEYAAGKGDPAATIVYGSMYGNTEQMMSSVAHGLASSGVPLEIFDAARVHASYILPALWINAGVLVGAPTYEVTLFPPVAEGINAAVHKRILGRKVAYFGSFGWSGGAEKALKKLVEPLKWEFSDSLIFMGSPKPGDLKRGEEFGRAFGERLKKSG